MKYRLRKSDDPSGFLSAKSFSVNPGKMKTRDRYRARFSEKQSAALHQFVYISFSDTLSAHKILYAFEIFTEIAIGDGPENSRITYPG